MDWSNERYVRIYTRKTVPYIMYPWQARAVRDLIYKEFDRAGVIDLGGYDPVDAVAASILMPRDVVEVGLQALLDDGTYVVRNGCLISENYIDAQEANQSDKARAKASREKRRAVAAKQNVTGCDATVTNRDAPVTKTDETVTPCRAVLNHAVPCAEARARGGGGEWGKGSLTDTTWSRTADIWESVTGMKVERHRFRMEFESIYRQAADVDDETPALQTVEAVTRACWADKWVQENRPGPAYLAKHFARFLAPPDPEKDPEYLRLLDEVKKHQRRYIAAEDAGDSEGMANHQANMRAARLAANARYEQVKQAAT